jgi:hypothetical protein
MGALVSRLLGHTESVRLYLPFASATHGRRPRTPHDWSLTRSARPLGRGTSTRALASTIYAI